jgi:hypothetical protein
MSIFAVDAEVENPLLPAVYDIAWASVLAGAVAWFAIGHRRARSEVLPTRT